jgi:multiple sugar transport system substrate-binding protein
MNIKKTTTFGLGLAIALSLAACGGDDGGGGGSGDTTAKGPIKIWLSNNPEEIAWGKKMVEAWNADHPDEEVTAEEIPAGKSSEEVIGAAITAGNAPCLVFNTSPAAVPQFQKQGGLVPLDSFPDGKEYIESRSGDTAEQYQSTDGQYYQLPWKANPVMIFYNKDLMKKAGVDPENPPLATYDEFLDTSEKIVSSGAAEAAIWPAPSSEFYQSWFDFYPLFAAETGGTQLVEDGKATFNSPEGEAVAEFWKTMYDEGYSQNEKYNGDSFADGTSYIETRSGEIAQQYKSPDGNYYQLPWKANPVMIFYNKEMMTAAGLDAENPPLGTYEDSWPPASNWSRPGRRLTRSTLHRPASSSSRGSISTRCSRPQPVAPSS